VAALVRAGGKGRGCAGLGVCAGVTRATLDTLLPCVPGLEVAGREFAAVGTMLDLACPNILFTDDAPSGVAPAEVARFIFANFYLTITASVTTIRRFGYGGTKEWNGNTPDGKKMREKSKMLLHKN